MNNNKWNINNIASISKKAVKLLLLEKRYSWP